MRKSFLKTFIVLGIFSIFLCGSFKIVTAQPMTAGASNPTAYNPVSDVNRAAMTPSPTTGSCGTFDFSCDAREIFSYMLIALSVFVTKIVSLAGYVFDMAIKTSTTYPSWGNSIKDAWKIIRDFTNIILVFSLLYLGIKTIYEGQGFAEKKTLAGIILAAILINFSFIFTKDIAFDLSNTVGLQVLQSVKSDDGGSYSAGLMQIVSPQKLISSAPAAAAGGWETLWNFAGQLILFSAITLSLGVVFLGVSLILLYRFIIFMILIIASPLGFVSTQIPWLKKHGSMWSGQLKQQVIFFPAFTLILYIVLLICVELASQMPSSLVVGTVGQGNSAIFDYIFKFILIMGFMIGLMILPSKMGAAGAGLMDKAGKGITQRLRKMPMRTLQRTGQVAASGTARAGRTFIGGGLGGGLIDGNSKFAKSIKSAAANPDSKWGGVARATLRRGEALKNSTFDIRNTKPGAKLGIGKGVESWSKLVDEKKKKMEKRKKDEEKLYGYDKLADDPANKINIEAAEKERDDQERKLNDRKEELKTAQERGVSQAHIDTIRKNIADQEKVLEKEELKVGKLKNIGDSEYIKLMEKRAHRIYKGGYNVAEREALAKIKKDLEKKWKNSGQSSKKRKEAAARARIDRTLSNPPGSPPPTPPSPPTS